MAQDLPEECDDGYTPRYGFPGNTYNRPFAGALKHIRQPLLEEDGFTGQGTAIAQIEKLAPSWFYRTLKGGDVQLPFGACVKPEDAASDHWGWAPENDSEFPELPCKIAWVMCMAADIDALEFPAENDGHDGAAGVTACDALVNGWDFAAQEINNAYKGGHATTVALGLTSSPPDTKIRAISIPAAEDRSDSSPALRWLYHAVHS